MSKRALALIMGIAVSGIAVWFWWQQTTHDKRNPVLAGPDMRIGRGYWPGFYWVDLAAHKNWFAEAGLKVELVDTSADYLGSLQAMLAGKMEANNFSLFDLMLFNARGADLVMIINSDTSLGVDALVARKDITSVPELVGKRIGVPKGSYLDHVLSVALAEYRLHNSSVVRVDILAEAAPEALREGTVDAIVAWDPIVTEAIEKSQGVKLFDTSQVPGAVTNGIAVSRRFIQEHPEAVQALVEVWHRTTTFIETNPDEAFAVIASIYNVTPAEAAALAQQDKILNLRDNQIAFTYAAGFESLHGTARTISKFLVENGLVDKRIDTDDYFSDRFIRMLDK